MMVAVLIELALTVYVFDRKGVHCGWVQRHRVYEYGGVLQSRDQPVDEYHSNENAKEWNQSHRSPSTAVRYRWVKKLKRNVR